MDRQAISRKIHFRTAIVDGVEVFYREAGEAVALYPRFQAYLREHRPPLLAVWGRNDPFPPTCASSRPGTSPSRPTPARSRPPSASSSTGNQWSVASSPVIGRRGLFGSRIADN